MGANDGMGALTAQVEVRYHTRQTNAVSRKHSILANPEGRLRKRLDFGTQGFGTQADSPAFYASAYSGG